MERTVKDQLIDFLTNNDLIGASQCGFLAEI